MRNIHQARRYTRRMRGFSLTELVVVVAIVLLTSTVVLVGHNNFRGSVLLSNLAYDVGLSIRQAQTYGLGTREASIGAGGFETGYGIHFDPATPDAYLLFADLDRDFAYDSNELVETFTIGGGYFISSVCATDGGSEDCDVGAIDAVFDRPEPDAIITDENGSMFASLRIVISSSQGTSRSVIVSAPGQIAVE